MGPLQTCSCSWKLIRRSHWVGVQILVVGSHGLSGEASRPKPQRSLHATGYVYAPGEGLCVVERELGLMSGGYMEDLGECPRVDHTSMNATGSSSRYGQNSLANERLRMAI